MELTQLQTQLTHLVSRGAWLWGLPEPEGVPVIYARLYPHGLFYARGLASGHQHWLPLAPDALQPYGQGWQIRLPDGRRALLAPVDFDGPDPERQQVIDAIRRGIAEGVGWTEALARLEQDAEEFAAYDRRRR